MKKYSFIFSTVLLLLFLGQNLYGQPLMSAKELKSKVNNEDYIIVSAEKAADYAKVHVANSVNIYPFDLFKPGDIKGVLKSPAELAEIFGAAGISSDKNIVVYDNGKGVLAGRLFWIFDYLGCDNIWILDGQVDAWRKARGPLTNKATDITPATFTYSLNDDIYVSTTWVQGHLNDAGTIIVDTRSAGEYNGEKGETSRKGHIPGAINLEYKNVINDDGKLKTAEELTTIFDNAGIGTDKNVVLYCETSNRTGLVYIALKYLLKYPNVEVYDGALYEWVSDASNAVE